MWLEWELLIGLRCRISWNAIEGAIGFHPLLLKGFQLRKAMQGGNTYQCVPYLGIYQVWQYSKKGCTCAPNKRHYDEIWIGFGLVWRCASNDSADVVVISLLIMLSTIYLVLLDPWLVWYSFVRPEAPLFFLVWSAAKTDLVVFGIVTIVTIPLIQIRDLT